MWKLFCSAFIPPVSFALFVGSWNGFSPPSAPSWDPLIDPHIFCRLEAVLHCISTMTAGTRSHNPLPTFSFFSSLRFNPFSSWFCEQAPFLCYCTIILSFSTGWTGAGIPGVFNGMLWFPSEAAACLSRTQIRVHCELATQSCHCFNLLLMGYRSDRTSGILRKHPSPPAWPTYGSTLVSWYQFSASWQIHKPL